MLKFFESDRARHALDMADFTSADGAVPLRTETLERGLRAARIARQAPPTPQCGGRSPNWWRQGRWQWRRRRSCRWSPARCAFQVRDFVHLVRGAVMNRPRITFPLIAFRDLRPGPGPQYCVKGILPRSGIVVVWGPPKCGKSFLAFDIAMHIVRAIPFRGRRVIGGPVVYLAFEGQDGFPYRVEAYRRHHGLADDYDPAFFLQHVANAKLVKNHTALIKDIKDQIGDIMPVVVVLDTLNRSIDGSESKDEDMGAYLSAADAIHQHFNCLVIIVHHCGVDGSRPRGHTSLTGTSDAQIAITKDEDGLITATVEFMKDGPADTVFTSTLTVVKLGVDEDGDDKTSCVIEPVGAGDASARPKKSPKDIHWEKSPLCVALRSVLADRGTDLRPWHDGPIVQACDMELVREEFYRSYVGDAKTKSKAEARRQAFHRALTKAQADKRITVREIADVSYVWLAKDAAPASKPAVDATDDAAVEQVII